MPERYLKGVLIAVSDVNTLRLLSKRNVLIRLECPGHPSYQARVQQLLKRLVPLPASDYWYLPVTKTGPLRQSGPSA